TDTISAHSPRHHSAPREPENLDGETQVGLTGVFAQGSRTNDVDAVLPLAARTHRAQRLRLPHSSSGRSRNSGHSGKERGGRSLVRIGEFSAASAAVHRFASAP